ncbi:hypothetical protein IFM89_007868 [Coptis chinensis]|uniref:Acyl-coenzyme A oxidase n=1 Tax=Coptis chinensis TaxID=261450 RepID=A0A835GVK0_9MAGN|nr:hypothetical protein IFM89_007868 [Coptis chinensis]
MDPVTWRTSVITKHLTQHHSSLSLSPQLETSTCLSYTPPEISENISFDTNELRKLLDGHNLYERDWLFGIMRQSNLFCPKNYNGRVFVSPDYNTTMEQQREMTMRRIEYLTSKGVFNGWLTGQGVDNDLRKFGLNEVIGMYDHSLAVKLGVHFFLWGGAIQFFGTKRHHDKWLKDTENYLVKGCFAMSELGHGSNVRGIETVTTYDSNTGEFVINTPCESAQKYWIGGAANHATHTIVFSQLNINGSNQGVHAFIAQIRDEDGSICPNVCVADCGHKIGLNGVDNGRIWFDNVRIPRENLLNAVADVSPDGQYLSAIKDPDQRFAAFMAPLTSGRVTIAVSAIYSSKISLAIAISCAMSFAANYLKRIYVKRTPETNKTIHVVSSAFKATFTWHNMKTLQECREACGGQGLKTENRVGHLKSEHDVQSTFEGDNNVLMQQVSKALIAEYIAAQRRKKPFKELGLEHMNGPSPVVPPQLTSTILRSNQFQNILGLLRSIYALVSLEEDASFLRYGYLSTENAAAVRKEVTKLCSELRPHALAVVSSFGIPDSFLSPIAYDWIAANSWSSLQQ